MKCRTCKYWGDDNFDISENRPLRICHGIDTTGLDAEELEQSGQTKNPMVCGDTSCNAAYDPYLVTPGGFGCILYESNYEQKDPLIRDGEYD